METNVKAIETVYHGYRFRSRLEARWAVYFDTCGWDWEYEPEGYDLNGTYYLPDFMLHDVWDLSSEKDEGQREYVGDLAVEVKGVMTEEDYEKVRLYQKYVGPILVLGNVPAGDCLAEIMTNIKNMWADHTQPCGKTCFYTYRPQVHSCTNCCFTCVWTEGKKWGIKDRMDYRNEPLPENICPFVFYTSYRAVIPGINRFPALISPRINGHGWEDDPLGNHYPLFGDGKKALEAFTAARQARFEHGETPRTFNHSLATNSKFDWDVILNE